MSRILKPRQLFAILFGLSLLLLQGCVTTETGVFTKKVDQEKALQTSVQLARKYISERNWTQAQRHLSNALEMDDESAEVNEGLALVYQNTGELERAEKHYREAVRLDPALSRVRMNYAAFLYSQQRYADARDQLEVAVEDTRYIRRDTAYRSLGRCYMQLGDYESAEKSLMRAHLMTNKRSPVLKYELAAVYYQLGEYPKSQDYYNKFRKDVTQQPPSALLLGARLAKVFDDNNGIASYGMALKNLYPRSQEYIDYQTDFGSVGGN